MKIHRGFVLALVIGMLVCILVLFGKSESEKICSALDIGKYERAVDLYNDSDLSSSERNAITEKIDRIITNSFLDWSEEKISYPKVKEMLIAFSSLNHDVLSEKALKQMKAIKIEYNGDKHMSKAEVYYDQKQYLKTLQEINSIDPKWSLYMISIELYDNARARYLSEITYPSAVEKYESIIDELECYLKKTSDAELANEKRRLENELKTFRYTESIVKEAYEKEQDGEYKVAFKIFNDGLTQYPKDIHLNTEKNSMAYDYIVFIANQVKSYVEEEKYEDALAVVNEAQKVYPCEDFDLLEDEILSKKSLVHKISSSIEKLTKGLVVGWKQEIDSVKRDGSKAYIIKSGKKVFLGNYSNDDVTILSTAGNVGISLAGMDFPADVRDLVYDVQNWGDGEYFVMYFASDVVALLPVVGAVKYAKYLKKTKATSEGAKNFCKVVLNTKQIKKGPKLRSYKYKKCVNQSLVGKTHPITNVKFVEKRVSYHKDGDWKVVVPVFKSKQDYMLPSELYKKDFSKQKEYLNIKLKNDVENDKSVRKQFTQRELVQIEKGNLPSNYVWHHNEKEGLMQLVDAKTHNKTAHTGGMNLWGKGYKVVAGY